ncbi:MAG: hypothetical protein HYY40_09460 [Bacteroidetes bacterium]|nr:hypothetical protein [Bacteroidota bacterium]
MKLIKAPVSKQELKDCNKERDGDPEPVKAVVDIVRKVIYAGAETHPDGEKALMDDGSRDEDLWGVNLFPDKTGEEWINFEAMINIRPYLGNPSRYIENLSVREQVSSIINNLIS